MNESINQSINQSFQLLVTDKPILRLAERPTDERPTDGTKKRSDERTSK